MTIDEIIEHFTQTVSDATELYIRRRAETPGDLHQIGADWRNRVRSACEAAIQQVMPVSAVASQQLHTQEVLRVDALQRHPELRKELLENLTFHEAHQYVKQGRKIARAIWADVQEAPLYVELAEHRPHLTAAYAKTDKRPARREEWPRPTTDSHQTVAQDRNSNDWKVIPEDKPKP